MKKLLMQGISFVGFSGIGWLLDFTTYTILGFFSEHLALNNMISSCVGVTFVFIFATRKIFQNNSRISLKWKYLIYIVYQFLLISLISKLITVVNLWIVSHITFALILKFSALLSKMLVTPISMVLNFFVMKGLIEKL